MSNSSTSTGTAQRVRKAPVKANTPAPAPEPRQDDPADGQVEPWADRVPPCRHKHSSARAADGCRREREREGWALWAAERGVALPAGTPARGEARRKRIDAATGEVLALVGLTGDAELRARVAAVIAGIAK